MLRPSHIWKKSVLWVWDSVILNQLSKLQRLHVSPVIMHYCGFADANNTSPLYIQTWAVLYVPKNWYSDILAGAIFLGSKF